MPLEAPVISASRPLPIAAFSLLQSFGQWDIEVEQVVARARFFEPGNIKGRAALEAGLEIEKSAGGLPWRNHPGRERAPFDFPGVERILFLLAKLRSGGAD